ASRNSANARKGQSDWDLMMLVPPRADSLATYRGAVPSTTSSNTAGTYDSRASFPDHAGTLTAPLSTNCSACGESRPEYVAHTTGALRNSHSVARSRSL